jgi:hypothetical protein
MFGIVASQNVPQVKRSSICKSGFSNGWQHGNLLNLLSTHYGHAPVLVVAHRFLFNPLFCLFVADIFHGYGVIIGYQLSPVYRVAYIPIPKFGWMKRRGLPPCLNSNG